MTIQYMSVIAYKYAPNMRAEVVRHGLVLLRAVTVRVDSELVSYLLKVQVEIQVQEKIIKT